MNPDDPIITVIITEQHVREIADGANGGNAVGECPMNETVAVALARAYAAEITAEIEDYAATLIAGFADRVTRITGPVA